MFDSFRVGISFLIGRIHHPLFRFIAFSEFKDFSDSLLEQNFLVGTDRENLANKLWEFPLEARGLIPGV